MIECLKFNWHLMGPMIDYGSYLSQQWEDFAHLQAQLLCHSQTCMWQKHVATTRIGLHTSKSDGNTWHQHGPSSAAKSEQQTSH